jgi:hypothetical protein
MGIMTLADFRQEVAEGLGRKTPEKVGIPKLDRWINAAMFEFGYALKFRELLNYNEEILVAGTNDVEQPENFRMVSEEGLVVLGVQGYEGKLLRETRSQYIKQHRTADFTALTGRPQRYHIFGPIFKVRPVADVDYTIGIHYFRRIGQLVDEESVSVFPDDWDDIIYTGALYRGFRYYLETERYVNTRNDFLGLIRSRKMEEDLEEFPEGGISGVHWRETEDILQYGDRASDPDDGYTFRYR